MSRRRRVTRDVLDHGDLLRTGGLVFVRLQGVRVSRHRLDVFSALVARNIVLHPFVIRADAFDVVVRGLKHGVRDQDDRDAVTLLDLRDFGALLVQEVRRDIDRNLSVDRAGTVLRGFFLDDAENLERGALSVTDDAKAVAARAGDVVAFRERWAESLAGEFHEAEAADLRHLHTGAVVLQGVLHAELNRALVAGVFHIDEVDHDETAKVAQTHLAGDFVRRFAVRAEGGFLNISAAGRAGRVHVDRDESLGVVDHDRAAGGQRHGAGVRGFNLVLDLEAGEERSLLAVTLHAAHHVRHHVQHELTGLVIDFVRVDENLADLGLEVVADRADHKGAFLNDEEGGRIHAAELLAVHDGVRHVGHHAVAVFVADEFVFRSRGVADRVPELQEIVEIPLQLLDRAADAGRAGDNRHPLRELQLFDQVTQFLALFSFDTAGNSASAGVLRHQDEVASGKRNKGREGGTLVAAFFLLHLHENFLAFAQRLADRARMNVHVLIEVAAGNFLEGEEAVALFAVVDEARFKRRLDAGDDALIDVGLMLLVTSGLDINIDELLSVNDRHAGFFGLRRVK